MCGIAGVVGSAENQSSMIRSICDQMAHRGPDDSGYFDSEGIHLGIRRLSIIDVDHGAQPVFGERERVVSVLNGEIYNYQSLQSQLRSRGHSLRSDSDSEVIPHLYEDFGVEFTSHLRGMFATAVWDADRKLLVLARDRVGEKPLYYHESEGQLWFASELRSLLKSPHISREIDPATLYQYLNFGYVPDPLSIFSQVKKLSPGHRLVWQAGNTTIERFWSLRYRPESDSFDLTDAELGEQFREKLVEATKIRMHSERPLGAFLSGGLDSSAVVAAMAQVSVEPVKSFSIGFADQNFNELPFAREVAQIFGTDHHEFIVEPDALDVLPQLARQFGEPYADSSAIPLYYLARMAREHVVVALNGDGGDESLAGYTTYKHFIRVPPGWRIPATLVRGARILSQFTKKSDRVPMRLRVFSGKADRLVASQPWERFGQLTSNFTPDVLNRELRPDFVKLLSGIDPFAAQRRIWLDNSETDPINRMLALDVGTYLPGNLLPKVDITTMAVSLEARSPFLDHEFMEWAAALPGTLKLRNGTTKAIMKQALNPWLPEHLINRKKKGFSVPLDSWISGPLQPMVRDLLGNKDSFAGQYLDNIQGILDDPTTSGKQVYSLLMLELWAKEVLQT